MNPVQRLLIWQAHLANAQATFDSASVRHPSIEPSLLLSIRNGWRGSIETASEMVSYYENKLA